MHVCMHDACMHVCVYSHKSTHIPCHTIPHYVISYHVTSCHIISYYLVTNQIISYHMASCQKTHIISYHIISYHIISYHIISYHIISYHTLCTYTCVWHMGLSTEYVHIDTDLHMCHIMPYPLIGMLCARGQVLVFSMFVGKRVCVCTIAYTHTCPASKLIKAQSRELGLEVRSLSCMLPIVMVPYS